MAASSSRPTLSSGSASLAAATFSTLVLLTLGGCARQPPAGAKSAVAARQKYVVRFTVTRLKDRGVLAAVSLPLSLGQTNSVQTDSRTATEDKPALPKFAATLTMTRTRGLYQLVTKVAIREAARNKKGKLKTSQRNEGALLPIRLGETQNASPDTDPAQIEVRVDTR